MLRLITPVDSFIDYMKLEYRLAEKPNFFQILNRRTNQTILSAFTHAQLLNGDVILTPIFLIDLSLTNEPLVLRACTNSLKQAKCSGITKFNVQIKRNNKMSNILINFYLF